MNTDKLAPVFLDNQPISLKDPKPKVSAILSASGKPETTDVKWLQFQPNTQGKSLRSEEVLDRTTDPSKPIYLTSGKGNAAAEGKGHSGAEAKGHGGAEAKGNVGEASGRDSKGSSQQAAGTEAEGADDDSDGMQSEQDADLQGEQRGGKSDDQ